MVELKVENNRTITPVWLRFLVPGLIINAALIRSSKVLDRHNAMYPALPPSSGETQIFRQSRLYFRDSCIRRKALRQNGAVVSVIDYRLVG